MRTCGTGVEVDPVPRFEKSFNPEVTDKWGVGEEDRSESVLEPTVESRKVDDVSSDAGCGGNLDPGAVGALGADKYIGPTPPSGGRFELDAGGILGVNEGVRPRGALDPDPVRTSGVGVDEDVEPTEDTFKSDTGETLGVDKTARPCGALSPDPVGADEDADPTEDTFESDARETPGADGEVRPCSALNDPDPGTSGVGVDKDIDPTEDTFEIDVGTQGEGALDPDTVGTSEMGADEDIVPIKDTFESDAEGTPGAGEEVKPRGAPNPGTFEPDAGGPPRAGEVNPTP